jgi:hypothetical protein
VCAATAAWTYATVVCPPGFYCGEGAKKPALCPPGTVAFNASDADADADADANAAIKHGGGGVGGASVEHCVACAAGFYCPQRRLNNSDGDVVSDAEISAAVAGVGVAGVAHRVPCPGGHTCPVGAAQPTPCAAGTCR